MWMLRSVLCVSVVCGLALDSNTIRSSKESALQSSELPDRSHDDRMETNSNSHRRQSPPCTSTQCNAPPQRGRCSNRADRRPSPSDGQADGQAGRVTGGQRDADGNRTKTLEMSSCVRSGDCADGLCCVRYLTGKRCQRIPVEGEACLLRGPTKRRRNLGRCDCDAGLFCTAVDRVETGKNKGQGVCAPRPKQGQRKTRHSGKKRRTAEGSC
nr:dickkopf-related protein 4 [Maylandia zebra]